MFMAYIEDLEYLSTYNFLLSMGIFKAFPLKNAPKYFTEAVSITWQEPVSLTPDPDYSQSSFLETIMEPSKCRLCFMISCLKCHAVIKPLRVSTKYQLFHQIISYDNAYVHCPVSTNFLTLKMLMKEVVENLNTVSTFQKLG